MQNKFFVIIVQQCHNYFWKCSCDRIVTIEVILEQICTRLEVMCYVHVYKLYIRIAYLLCQNITLLNIAQIVALSRVHFNISQIRLSPNKKRFRSRKSSKSGRWRFYRRRALSTVALLRVRTFCVAYFLILFVN